MMMNYPIVPYWFAGYNAILELIFFAITLLVGLYAIKIYKLSGQRQSKLFGVSFLMISSSYLIQSILNFAASYSMSGGCSMKSMASMHTLSNLGIMAYMAIFTAGLVTLCYMTFKSKDAVSYLFFLGAILAVLFLSSNKLYFFYVLCSVLLIYISFYYLRNYIQTRNSNSLLVLVAFLFLLFGKMHFIFSIDHGTFYVAGHLLELVAYALILANLLMITRRK